MNQEKSTPPESDREPLDLDDLSVDPEETRIVHRGRVVVAEDEALIRLDVVETLTEAGYEVVGEAGDGEKAIELATELKPDLVVMDVKMPVLDGISAAEKISKARIALWCFSQPFLRRSCGARPRCRRNGVRGEAVHPGRPAARD